MASIDVFSACKQGLNWHAASYLKSLEFEKEEKKHTCMGPMIIDVAAAIERSIEDVTLATIEESSGATSLDGWNVNVKFWSSIMTQNI
jgi:hypothetical protein